MKGRIKKFLSEKTTVLGVAVGVIGITAGSIMGIGNMQIWKQETGWHLLREGLQSRILCFLIPIVATMSGTDLYLREKESGFIKFSIVRQDKRRYQREKTIQIFYQTIGIWTTVGCVSLLLCQILGSGEIVYVGEGGNIGDFLNTLFLFGKAIMISLALAYFGASCGILTKTIYLTMGIPFVFYYFFILIQERYFEGAKWLSPAHWMTQEKIGIWVGLAAGVFLTWRLYEILLKRELCEI